jgi:hypothetical protein
MSGGKLVVVRGCGCERKTSTHGDKPKAPVFKHGTPKDELTGYDDYRRRVVLLAFAVYYE